MEEKRKKLKDIIIPLSNYPHMPYWGTLREAIAQLNVAYETGHHTVLVFDEGYKLVGMLHQKDILQGLVPKFAQHYEEGVPIFWDDLMEAGNERRLALQIKEFMSGVKHVAEAEDNILKAAHMILQEKSYLLPVMQDGKLIGVVRMGDLFHEITNALLKL
jgi:CBS-domain-containing membrane protein